MDIKFTQCKWEDIHSFVQSNIKKYHITVDSYWEGFALWSNHYLMTCGNETAGYFAINRGDTIALFNVFPFYANFAQELFARVKKYEHVTNAIVATGDEFFLSHCLDSFARIEKEMYMTIFTEKDMPHRRFISLRSADYKNDNDIELIKLCGDFFGSQLTQIEKGKVPNMKIYIAEDNGELVGFGCHDLGRVVNEIASIGMFVCESKREQGYGSSIIRGMKDIVNEMGYEAYAACDYYNHNSKKTMESAGAYTKSRLIRFYF